MVEGGWGEGGGVGGGDVGGGRGGERAKNVYRAARFPYMYILPEVPKKKSKNKK